MSKQIQDAYIVDEVRTPVGKAPRGMFRNGSPDDLMADVLKGVMAKVTGLATTDVGAVSGGEGGPGAAGHGGGGGGTRQQEPELPVVGMSGGRLDLPVVGMGGGRH